MLTTLIVVFTGTCDFEQKGCSWADVSTGSERWIVGSNVSTTSTMGQGPAFDHTLGSARGQCL